MNISVVIPAYNREKTIRMALQSVLSQTCLPQEVIVVDDCSTDHTIEIVKEMRQETPLIRLICLKKNRGAQVARNVGIKVSKGDWIAFLDSDDEWTNDKIESFLSAYSEHPEYDVYFSDYYVKEKNRIRYKKCNMPHQKGNYLKSILFESKVLFPTMVVRKQALIDINYLDERVVAFQEWDTNIRLAVKHKYYYISKPLFIYNLHDGETISKDDKRAVKGYKYIMISNGELLLSEGTKGVKQYLNSMYIRYKRCNDLRMHCYWLISKIVTLLSLVSVGENLVVKFVRFKWKIQRNMWKQ